MDRAAAGNTDRKRRRGPRTQAPGTGEAAPHTDGAGRPVGPFEKIGPATFRVSLQKETTGTEKQYELVLAATQPGDAEYRPAVQQAHMFIPANNTAGADQHITFLVIPNRKVGVTAVKLAATSDAGVPVSYYVREGPAEVEGDTLTFTAIPPRARFPVKVTVVAWQYGRSVEPLLKSANPVEQTFQITR